jgi:hypothetical protein
LFTFREAGMQVSPVTMSCPSLRTAVPPCLPLDIKDSLKKNLRFFALRAFALWLFALGFLPEAFVFGFLMWVALEGKRIIEGKRIAEGKVLEGNC